MAQRDDERSINPAGGLSRRDLLQTGSFAVLGLSLPHLAFARARAAVQPAERNCIFLFLVGGPGHLDTFDPKPNAPAEIRGPYRPIRTSVPGIQISEILPRTAGHADKYAILRSMCHDAAAVHETGHQMMQTGRLFRNGPEHPHAGCVYGFLKGQEGREPPRGRRAVAGGSVTALVAEGAPVPLPPHVLLPRPIGNTGGNMPHGQTAGFLGRQHDPYILSADPSDERFRLSLSSAHEAFRLDKEPETLRDTYGRNRFGQSCLLARRLIERGVRFVTVNMFENVLSEATWDVHGSMPFNTVASYERSVAPMFDHAYSTLLQDLTARGLLHDTLVVAAGEFGRTPRINPAGGRDHWPQCWSVLFAGGGVRGGQVIGASDEIGAYPKDRPTKPAEVVATIYHSMGIDLEQKLPGPDGRRLPVVDAGVRPINELF